MKQLRLHIGLTLSVFCILLFAEFSACAQTGETGFSQRVGNFLDEWHDDAAHGNMGYFDKMAQDGVYIGTDKSERWVRDDFKTWAKPYFDRKKAWEFHAFNRHIAWTEDKTVIWFDEQLHTQMGICQASGVIRNTKDGLKIEHYQLSVAIPNDLVDRFKKEIETFEAQPPKK